MKTKFTSPREEAFEIAFDTRKSILDENIDTVSVLRSCLVISTNLNKNDITNWIKLELLGNFTSDELPDYRLVSCRVKKKIESVNDPIVYEDCGLYRSVHRLSEQVKSNYSFNLWKKGRTKYFEVTVDRVRGVLSIIIDKCFFFLNDIISELQYGGIVEYLMEEIRRNTDEKLNKLGKKLSDETKSLYLNLTSTNPADWNKVAHSCRKTLKLFAEHVFPPRDESYKMKDNRLLEVGDAHFINRLCAFVDQKSGNEERKFLIAETKYLESYLRQVVRYDQMGEHKPSIEKFHANNMDIHTYLIISEILKLYSEQVS